MILCQQCQKAKKWLLQNNIEFIDRHILEDTPTADELREYIKKSGMPVKKFFNTSGLLYKSMGLKDRLADMSEDEMIELLSENGMLIKRPVIAGDNFAYAGFKDDVYKELFLG